MLLTYAETQGRIVLLLRNDRDVVTEPQPDVGASELDGAQEAPAPNPQANPQASPGDYPTIYVPGQAPRSGNLPGGNELLDELRKLKPEDARKRILQELQKPSPTQP